MCRWLGCCGGPIRVERLLFEPEHSLIDQNLSARSGPSTTNGDGFGLGWYGDRDVRPAWNDPNLREVAAEVTSHQFLAHVRATTGTAVERRNCHPFRSGPGSAGSFPGAPACEHGQASLSSPRRRSRTPAYGAASSGSPRSR